MSIRKSLALSFAGKYSSLAIHTVSVVVLARLLTPEEIGVYSVGAAAVALAHMLREFGVGNYLVQERDLTQDRIRTAFGVALVIAWVMAAVLFALSGPVSDFYDEPGLRQVLRVLSVTFLLIPFGTPTLALLHRDMAFGRIYVVSVATALAHVTTGITLAALGFGFMSLAWAALAGTVMTVLIAAIYRPSVARLLPGFSEWRRVLSFGSYMSASSIVATIGMSAPDLILGRLLGFTAVGLFSRAAGVIQIFNRTVMHAVSPVMTPAFAAKDRRGDDLLGPYLRGTSYVTVLAWPFFIFLGFMAYPIIRILFGDQWDAAVPIIQILCLGMIFRSLYYFDPSVFIGLGQVRRNLIVILFSTSVFVPLFFLGALHSLEAAALSSNVSVTVHFIVSHTYIRPVIGLTLSDVLGAVSKSFAVALLSAIVPAAVFFGMDMGPENLWMPFLIALLGTGTVWIGAVFAVNHPLREEIAMFRQRLRLNVWTKGFRFRSLFRAP